MKSHIPLPWVMAYDNEPLKSAEEKARLLPTFLERDTIIFYEHDPYRAASHLIQTDKGFQGGEDISSL